MTDRNGALIEELWLCARMYDDVSSRACARAALALADEQAAREAAEHERDVFDAASDHWVQMFHNEQAARLKAEAERDEWKVIAVDRQELAARVEAALAEMKAGLEPYFREDGAMWLVLDGIPLNVAMTRLLNPQPPAQEGGA